MLESLNHAKAKKSYQWISCKWTENRGSLELFVLKFTSQFQSDGIDEAWYLNFKFIDFPRQGNSDMHD